MALSRSVPGRLPAFGRVYAWFLRVSAGVAAFTPPPPASCALCRSGAMVGRQRGRAWMLLVTGGAGFIGSNFVASLNEAGRSDIVVNDTLGTDDKWRNLSKRQI